MKAKEKRFWIGALNRNYRELKRRSGSHEIYSTVSRFLNYLEGWDEIPQGMNLAAELDALCQEIRSS